MDNMCINKIKDMKFGYYLAQLTDRLAAGSDIQQLQGILNSEKLLDIRVFNEEAEFHCFRRNLRAEFSSRFVSDDQQKIDSFDEEQYIETDRSRYGTRYDSESDIDSMPIVLFDEMAKYRTVTIRYYFDEYSDGAVYIRDWRMVRLGEVK